VVLWCWKIVRTNFTFPPHFFFFLFFTSSCAGSSTDVGDAVDGSTKYPIDEQHVRRYDSRCKMMRHSFTGCACFSKHFFFDFSFCLFTFEHQRQLIVGIRCHHLKGSENFGGARLKMVLFQDLFQRHKDGRGLHRAVLRGNRVILQTREIFENEIF
jgi:hypothetical protein